MTRAGYILRWNETPWAYELQPGVNRIGRDKANDFRILSPSVSPFHAEIFWTEEGVFVRALPGASDVSINGVNLVEDGAFLPGMVLRIGSEELELEARWDWAEPKTPVPPWRAPPSNRRNTPD